MNLNRKKVLLIKPFNYFFQNEFLSNSTEPIGLISLATYIEDFCDVMIYDATVGENGYIDNQIGSNGLVRVGVSNDQIRKQLLDFNPDIIGLSAYFFTQALAIKETLSLIKVTLPDTKLVVGGNYATCIKKDFMEIHPEVDVLVYGEGEITFRELCKNDFKDLRRVLGILYRGENGDIICNPSRPLIENLDDLRIFNRKLVDSRVYHLVNAPFFNPIKIELHKILLGSLLCRLLRRSTITIPKSKFLAMLLSNNIIFKIYAKTAYFMTRKSYNPISADIETSRGCPFSCVFCAVKNTWTRKFRSRSINHIKTELKYLKVNSHIKHINITDDVFNINRNRIYELCDIFQELNIMSWRPLSGLYIMSLNQDILHRMFETGCKHINLIIESGCQETLDNIIKKNVDIEYAKSISRLCMEIGFNTQASFVIGFPGETKRAILETIKYAFLLRIDSCNFWFATPFPGTELFDICEKNGYLPDNFTLSNLHQFYHSNFGQPMIETEHFTLQEIKNVRETAITMISQRGHWSEWKDKLFESINYDGSDV